MGERWRALPERVRNEIEQLGTLQNLIITLTEENLESTASLVVDSTYVQSDSGLLEIARLLLSACLVRPRNTMIYAKFCVQLRDRASPTNALDHFKDMMAGQILHWWWNSQADNIYTFAMFLVSELAKLGFFSAQGIVEHSIRALRGKFQFVSHIACFLLYFGKECREREPQMFALLERKCQIAYERGELMPHIAKYWENYEELKRTNWAAIMRVRSNICHGNDILKAIMEDNVAEFEKLINGDVNRVYESPPFSIYSLLDKWTFKVVDVAAIFGSVKVFEYLVSRGARIGDDKYGTTLITSCAAVGQNMQIIKRLTLMGADFSCALAPAVRCYSQAASKWIMERYPESIFKKSVSGSTVLTQALLLINIEMFKILMEKGVDVNAPDDSGLTPFECLGEIGSEIFLKCFLSLPGVDKTKGNPLHAAAQAGHSNSVRLLLENEDIDPNAVLEDGQCPLTLAITNSHAHSVRLLLDHPRVKIDSGYDFLALAAQQNLVEIFEMVAEKVKSDSWKTWSVTSPLACAIRYGMFDMFEYLLAESGVDVNSKDESHNGVTMIWLAVQQQQLKIAEMLLDIPECSFENSALVLAMSNHDTEMIELLNKHINQCTS